MQITVDFNIEQILLAIKQLPTSQLKEVKKVVDQSLFSEKTHENSELKKLILKGPLMSDEQYEAFLENRKNMNQWRTL
jgi:hypothetical protein